MLSVLLTKYIKRQLFLANKQLNCPIIHFNNGDNMGRQSFLASKMRKYLSVLLCISFYIRNNRNIDRYYYSNCSGNILPCVQRSQIIDDILRIFCEAKIYVNVENLKHHARYIIIK